ncbi:hypothetical protein CFP56_012308, partial [Quercus suber]
FKTNYHVAVFEHANTTSIGVVIHNDKGEVLTAVSKKISMPLSVVIVEMLAAKRVV